MSNLKVIEVGKADVSKLDTMLNGKGISGNSNGVTDLKDLTTDESHIFESCKIDKVQAILKKDESAYYLVATTSLKKGTVTKQSRVFISEGSLKDYENDVPVSIGVKANTFNNVTRFNGSVLTN